MIIKAQSEINEPTYNPPQRISESNCNKYDPNATPANINLSLRHQRATSIGTIHSITSHTQRLEFLNKTESQHEKDKKYSLCECCGIHADIDPLPIFRKCSDNNYNFLVLQKCIGPGIFMYLDILKWYFVTLLICLFPYGLYLLIIFAQGKQCSI